MAEPGGKETKKTSRRLVLKGGAILGLAAALELDSETSGIICPEGVDPDFFGLFTEEEIKAQSTTAHQLWADPASRSSLITLCLASYAETSSDTGTVKGKQTGLHIEFDELPDVYSNEDLDTFPNRASLRNISIQDPGNPRNTINLEMIAHHRDPKTSLNVCVFHENTTNNLLFVCPGFDKASDLFEVNDTVSGRPDPADGEIANLMMDVLQQVQKRGMGKKLEHVTVFGHSLGAGPATEILAHLIHDQEYQTLLHGIKPKVAFIEEWKATETAQNIASHAGWPSVKELSGYITSVRRVPGTVTAQPDNPVLGKSARAIVPDNLWQLIRADEGFIRQLGHEETDIAEDLFVKRDKLVETTPAVLNQVQPTALFRVADLVWQANVKPGIDIGARIVEGAALAAYGGKKWHNRCQRVQEEKDARDAERVAARAGRQGRFTHLIRRGRQHKGDEMER